MLAEARREIQSHKNDENVSAQWLQLIHPNVEYIIFLILSHNSPDFHYLPHSLRLGSGAAQQQSTAGAAESQRHVSLSQLLEVPYWADGGERLLGEKVRKRNTKVGSFAGIYGEKINVV